jgi:hypothetical protein
MSQKRLESKPHVKRRSPATIGDVIAARRAALAQRLVEARGVVASVLASLPASVALPEPGKSWAQQPAHHTTPLQEAELLRRDYLDYFKAAVFNGPDSVRLAVGGGPLKRMSRRLCEAAEQLADAIRPVDALAAAVGARHSGFVPEVCRQAAAALIVLGQWDRTPAAGLAGTHGAQMTSNLLNGLARTGSVRLALFVCPPVNFRMLRSPTPVNYLGAEMAGSVLSRQIDRLRDLFRGLEGAEVDYEVLVLVGDTDEDQYLWPSMGRPPGLDENVLDEARDALCVAVAAYLLESAGAGRPEPRVARGGAVRVQRLSAMVPSPQAKAVYEAIAAIPERHFGCEDFAAETDIMHRLWAPNSYYEGLPRPGDEVMEEIVARKFAAYAMQGVQLHEQDPDLVLIQTERPPLLRSKMLNAGRSALGQALLPIVSFHACDSPFIL